VPLGVGQETSRNDALSVMCVEFSKKPRPRSLEPTNQFKMIDYCFVAKAQAVQETGSLGCFGAIRKSRIG
jgi:hypothetical protein